ncbi:MAG: hypothetical protein JWN18_421 [Parcubacteria group bacterium]|nr:hypothetical protein [Parcubacteria group bacterium]
MTSGLVSPMYPVLHFPIPGQPREICLIASQQHFGILIPIESWDEAVLRPLFNSTLDTFSLWYQKYVDFVKGLEKHTLPPPPKDDIVLFADVFSTTKPTAADLPEHRISTATMEGGGDFLFVRERGVQIGEFFHQSLTIRQ